VVSLTPRPLNTQGNSPRYPLDRRLGGPQSRSGRGGEEKNSQPPPGIEPLNPDRPARNPALYRLSYHYESELERNVCLSPSRLLRLLVFQFTFYTLPNNVSYLPLPQVPWSRARARARVCVCVCLSVCLILME
jgi:hypothetical protein